MKAGKHSKRIRSLKPWHLGVFAGLLSVLLVIVLAVFGSSGATDDDLGIAFALSGLYPDSGLCLFVNAFISHLTLLLSGLLPGVNAFFLVEYCLVALGVFVIAYVALVYLDDRVVALCLIGLLVLLLVPSCTFKKNFTAVATLVTLAGFFALIMQVRSRRFSVPLSIIAVILCVFGFMMRLESFLLALPFVAIAFVYRALSHYRGSGSTSGERGIIGILVPLMAVIVLCVGAYAFDTAEWNAPQWSEWKAYNHARSAISDYSMPDYAQIEQELSAGGITEIDYTFAQTWRTADKDVFTVDSLEFIASFGDQVSNEAVAGKMLRKAWSWIVKYWFAIPLAIALLVLYIMRARRLSARANVAVALSVALFAAITFYLASGGRLPQRVMHSLMADAVVCLAIIVGEGASASKQCLGKGSSEKLRGIASSLGVLFCVVSAGFLIYSSHPSWGDYRFDAGVGGPAVESSVTEYIRSNDDVLYVMDTNTQYWYLLEYGMKQLPPQDELERVILLGGWSTDSPYINARNEMMGMDNVMKGLVENDRARYLVLASSKKRVSEMEAYLETHYWNDVVVELEDSFKAEDSEYLVYNFSVGK